jgi:hypothetical protein
VTTARRKRARATTWLRIAVPLVMLWGLLGFGGAEQLTLASHATPAAVAAAAPVRPAANIGIANIVLSDPELHSGVQEHPKRITTIVFTIHEQTVLEPQEFHGQFTLFQWVVSHAHPFGIWADTQEDIFISKSDLAHHGDGRTLTAKWGCIEGRYMIKMDFWGTTENGTKDKARFFFPWYKFDRHKFAGDPKREPRYKDGWVTDCNGNDEESG